MDYGRFVENRERDWHRMEALVDRVHRGESDYRDLERLAAWHRRVMGDFAWCRDRYPGTEAEQRLRALAFAGHRLLSGAEEPVRRRLWRFLRYGYRRRFQEEGPLVATALLVFLGCVLLGFVLTAVRPEMAGLFLGEEALAGLRRGEIWTDSVSGLAPPTVLSSRIFTNNISVALVAWGGGLLLGAGSLYILLYNGLMFGGILALCHRYELLGRLLDFVAAHGPLELFLVVVAAAAGLGLARGELVARNRPRSEVLQAEGRRSLELVAGTLPWFVLLGLVEGTISPNAAFPAALKAAVGVVLLVAFLAYAGVRPRSDGSPARAPSAERPSDRSPSLSPDARSR